MIRERANLLSVMCFCLFSMVNYYYHVDFLDEDEAHPRKQTVHKEGCSELPLENRHGPYASLEEALTAAGAHARRCEVCI